MGANIRRPRNETSYVDLTTILVSAYVVNNSILATEVAGLIARTHAALVVLGNAGASDLPVADVTDAQIRSSITHEALISFEDRKPYKTLKRHLKRLGLTPEAYRAKWGLPKDYPITAAAYSERRSALARNAGLGRRRSG